MEISELFQQLSVGELSNLAISDDGQGYIREEARLKILIHCNEALLRLYTRFLLKESEVTLITFPNITNYFLLKKYGISQKNTEKGPFYIMDKYDEPFSEDVIKVLYAVDKFGNTIPLNSELEPFSIFTPQFNIVQVPYPERIDRFSLVYQASHPVLTTSDLAGSDAKKIELPPALHGALRAYIAYCVFSNMNTQESSQKAQEHLGFFEGICEEVSSKNIAGADLSETSSKFEKRGWV